MYKIVKQLKMEILNDPFFGNANRFVLDKIGDVQNKVILDSGCGTGKMSLFFALQGAKVIGIDKRKSALIYAKKLAQSYNVQDNCLFIQGYSESMPIHSEVIDLIYSKSTIQYMNHNKVLDEYTQIMKPAGIVVLIENLPYPPIINLYRFYRKVFSRSPKKIKYINSIRGYITLNEIETFSDRFQYSQYYEYHLFRTLSISLRANYKHNYLIKKIDIILSNLDKKLLILFPILKNIAWFTALYCKIKINV